MRNIVKWCKKDKLKCVKERGTRLANLMDAQIHTLKKELEITPVLDKLLEYKRNWIRHVNTMPRDRLPRIMKHYSPTGRRNRDRPLKRLLDT